MQVNFKFMSAISDFIMVILLQRLKLDSVFQMSSRRVTFTLVALTAFVVLLLPVAPVLAASCGVSTSSSATSNFNGTSISSGNYVWFNSVLTLTGTIPSSSTTFTVFFTSQTITVTPTSGPAITLTPPNAEVIYSPTASTATTAFTGGEWVTTVPWSSQGTGNQFLSGYAYLVPATPQLSGSSVSWTGTFSATLSSGTGSYNLNWQYGGAVYTSFSTNYNSLGVKPIDANTGSAYLNSDHAGTPENYKSFVTGGAQGGGGSNYTGSYSSTGSACFTPTPPTTSVPEFPVGAAILAAFAVPLVLMLRSRKLRLTMTS